jgi:hypothetical protein
MGTTRGELKRKVLMGIKDLGGEDMLMAEEAINMACYAIAMVHNFGELTVMDRTNCHTADGTKNYSLTTALLLTRPKDIISIVLHDDNQSRKLTYKTPQWIDSNYPYPEAIGEGRPEIYTQRVDQLELIPIPDAIYDLYVNYAQWPLALTADTTECSYTNKDFVVVGLARDIFLAMRGGIPLDPVAKAKGYMDTAMRDDRSGPDALPVAQGFQSSGPSRADSTTLTLDGVTWNIDLVRGGR